MHFSAATAFARAMHLGAGFVTFISKGRTDVAGRPDERAHTVTQAGDFGQAFIAYNEAHKLGTSLLIGQADIPVNNRMVAPSEITSTLYIGVQFGEDTASAAEGLRHAPKPTVLLSAGHDVFAVWKLSAPVRGKEINEICARVAERLGGKAALFIPLPGTHRGRTIVSLDQHIKHLAYEPSALTSGEAVPQELTLVRADQITEPPTQWLWENYVPEGNFAIFMGPPKIGKSQIVIDLAARLSRGGQWPDGSRIGETGSSAIFENEDTIGETKARAEAACADLSRLMITRDIFDLSTPAGVAALERKLDTLDNPKLVMLSPVRMFFGANEGHKQTVTRARLEPLLAMASRRKISIVGVGHREAGKKGNSAEEMAGPKGLTQRARAVLNVTEDVTDPVYKLHPKRARRLLVSAGTNNGDDTGMLPFKIGGVSLSSGHTAPRIEWLDLGPEQRAAQRDGNILALPRPRAPVEDWLRDRLADGEKHEAAAIVAEGKYAGYAKTPLYDALQKIGGRHEKVNVFPASALWWLPK